MNKFVSILLVLATAVCLCACGGVTNEPADTEPVVPDVPVYIDPEYGTVVDGTYTAPFVGVTCIFPPEWSFYTEQEIDELNALAQQASSVDDTGSADTGEVAAPDETSATKSVYDLFAFTDNGFTTVNASYTRLDDPALTAGEYINMSMGPIRESLTAMGFEGLMLNHLKMDFAGQERDCLTVSGVVNGGIPMYERMVVIIYGGYAYCVSASCYVADMTSDLLGMFAPIAAGTETADTAE